MEEAPLFSEVARGPEGGQAFWLRADDGVRLRVGIWARGARGTVFVFPGRSEVIEKYGLVARRIAAEGWGVLTLDWRGQGLSDRLAADGLGHVRRFADYQRDVAVLSAVAERVGLAGPWMLLAHSMGGCIGLRSLLRGLPVKAAAFSAPMWGLPLGTATSFAARGLGVMAGLAGRGSRRLPGDRPDFALTGMSFDDNVLTTDRAMFDYMQAQVRAHPELALGAPTLGWISSALAEMRALARRRSPQLPAYAAVGTREKVVSIAPIPARMNRWPGGRFEEYPGAEHELMMEAAVHRTRFLDAALALFDEAAA